MPKLGDRRALRRTDSVGTALLRVRDRLPRLCIIVAYGVMVFNIEEVFGFEAANIVQKGLFLIASILCLLLRRITIEIVLLLIVTIVMILFLGAATTYRDFSWQTLVFSLNQVTIIYALLAYHPSSKDAESFLVVAAWLPLASTVVGLIYAAAGWHEVWQTEWLVDTPRFRGSLIPAFLSGFAMCGVFAALQLALRGRRVFYYGVLVADTVILLLAAGRGPMAVALLVSACSVLTSTNVALRIKLTASLIGGMLLTVLIVVIGEAAISRFQYSTDNGREVMWAYLRSLSAEYPWTGIGWGHQYLSVPHEVEIHVGSTSAHNDFLRLIVELGVMGMPAFYLFLSIAVLIAAWRGSRFPDPVVIGAYAGFLILSRTDNALASPSHFPIIILATMASARYRNSLQFAPRLKHVKHDFDRRYKVR